MAELSPMEKWKREKARQRGEVVDDESFKHPSQVCNHPKNKVVKGGGLPGEGGKYDVCTLCGRIVNDED